MPRRRLPAAIPDGAPTQAPKKKRQRAAAPKIVGKPARKRTKAKAKAVQHIVVQPLLQLPAPRPLLLLTYAGPSQQIESTAIANDLLCAIERTSAREIIGSGPEADDAVTRAVPCGSLSDAMPVDTTNPAPKQKRKHPAAGKTARKLARRLKTMETKSSWHAPTPPRLPPAPQIDLPMLSGVGDQIGSSASGIHFASSNAQLSAPRVARAEPQPVDAVRQDQSAPSDTRPADTPETFPEPPQRPVLPRARRAYSIGPRIAATVGFTAAVIGTVLLLARPSSIKPNDIITQHHLIPAETRSSRT